MSTAKQPLPKPIAPFGPESYDANTEALADQAMKRLNSYDRHEHRVRAFAAGAILATTVAVGWAVQTGAADHVRFNHPMSYSETAQKAVIKSEDVAKTIGIAAFILGGLGVAAVKGGGLLNTDSSNVLKTIDQWSSRDMSEDRLYPKRSFSKKTLEAVFAGRIPLMASLGALLAVFSTALSTEVSEGPQRPIVYALDKLTPGDTMLVNYDGVMSMVDSTVPKNLADKMIKEAEAHHISAKIFDKSLGVITANSISLTDTAIGIAVSPNSPIYFGANSRCDNVPITVDKTSSFKMGQNVEVNGVSAVVKQREAGLSASNRVGVLMDQTAMARCLHHDKDAPVHSVVFDSNVPIISKILESVASDDNNVKLITKEKYLQNNLTFFESNVKPLTVVLSLVAGIVASAAAGYKVKESLIRNRREWAAKLASGNSEWVVRSTEALRLIKDGMLGTIVGGTAAAIATPFVVNSLESGFQASIGLREIAVGAAVAIGGSLAGGFKTLLHPKKIIRTEESLRS